MIDERKEKAITLIIEGNPIIDIAKLVGVDRTTIYNWLDNEEFANELDKRRHEIATQGNNMILNELGLYIKELKRIALTDKSAKIRSDTAQYLVDRVLGKPTTKVEQSTDIDSKDKVSTDLLEQTVKEVNNETSKNPETQS